MHILILSSLAEPSNSAFQNGTGSDSACQRMPNQLAGYLRVNSNRSASTDNGPQLLLLLKKRGSLVEGCDSLIHNVYVIDAESGICLLSRKYGSIELDENIVSGYFTAIRSFIGEIAQDSGKPLREKARLIDMGVYDIVYVHSDSVLAVACIDKRDDENVVRRALEDITQRFTSQFENELREATGEIAIFNNFRSILDEVLIDGTVGECLPILKRKIPKMVLSLGMIDEDVYRIAEFCDGTRTPEDIADQAQIDLPTVLKDLEKLEKMGLIVIERKGLTK